MRIKFLIAGLLGIASTTAFAQKYELSNAKETYDKYVTLSKVKATYVEADKNLNAAKVSIDKAATNTKTTDLPQTYALKAAVYATYSMRDTVAAKTLPFFNTADEALKKAKDLDTKGENKALILDASNNLAQYQLNKGVADFKNKQFDLAYKDFDYFHQLFPEDTTALHYSGLAAVAAKNYPAAITAYTKLLPLKFSKMETIYLDLSSIYLTQKDTVNSLKLASDGVEKFPASSDLRRREIEISLQSGKAQQVLSKIQAAIANDPKNKTLYYYAGLTYTSFANNINEDILKLKKTDGKDLKESILPPFVAKLNPLQAKKDDYLAKAVDMFKKALEIDPNYPEVNQNIGYALLAPAIDTYNFANNYLPPSKQKEYNITIAKATAMAEAAKPYLLKATELNPKSVDALRNLKNYYLVTKDMTNANDTQKKIEALLGGN
jgi:tetratricopeptide (TPR) repeat protein